jgi:hypothetical protein
MSNDVAKKKRKLFSPGIEGNLNADVDVLLSEILGFNLQFSGENIKEGFG